jgi:hypothetical protein
MLLARPRRALPYLTPPARVESPLRTPLSLLKVRYAQASRVKHCCGADAKAPRPSPT